MQQHKEWRAKGIEVDYVAIGSKGLGFLSRMGGNVVSQRGAARRPAAARHGWSGRSRCCSTNIIDGKVDEVHIFFTNFINTMRQEPRHGRMLPIPEQFRTAGRRGAQVADVRTARGTTSTSPTRKRAARRRAAALRRGARLPDGQREHGVRAVGADGRDEGRLRQRRQRSSTSCSSSTTRRGRRRSPRNWRRSSAARPRSNGELRELRLEKRGHMNQGTIVQCIGAVVDVEFPRDRDAEDLRRAQDGRDRADARSAAAAGRRHRAHDRARLVRRSAPRHEGRQHRRADHGAGRHQDARPHHGRARPPDRRARPGRRRKGDVDPPRRRRRSTSCRRRRSCSRPASRSSTSSARSPRAARSACSAAPASARP